MTKFLNSPSSSLTKKCVNFSSRWSRSYVWICYFL